MCDKNGFVKNKLEIDLVFINFFFKIVFFNFWGVIKIVFIFLLIFCVGGFFNFFKFFVKKV